MQGKKEQVGNDKKILFRLHLRFHDNFKKNIIIGVPLCENDQE